MTIRILASDIPESYHFLLWLDLRLPDLEPGRRYRLKELLAVTDWDETCESSIDKACLFSRLITTGRVPFEVAGTFSTRENLYRVTPSERVCEESMPSGKPRTLRQICGTPPFDSLDDMVDEEDLS